MDLSIIIVSYNTCDITKKCLETLCKSLKTDSTIKYEIIIIDNASTDGSIEMLKKVKGQMSGPEGDRPLVEIVKCIFNKENFGFSKANNQAAKIAKGECLLFLNSDIEVIDDAIPALFNFFKNQDGFQFVGGKLLNKDGSPQPSCGPMFSLPVIFAFLFLKGDYYGLTRYSPDKIKEVAWVSGACIITKKEYFDASGGFDEGIFMYMEEIDLLYRAAKIGMKTGFFPGARFTHLGMASSAGRAKPIIQVYRGYIYFYKKHMSKPQLNLLKIMLKLKALISIFLGKIADNQYLLKTYTKAYEILE